MQPVKLVIVVFMILMSLVKAELMYNQSPFNPKSIHVIRYHPLDYTVAFVSYGGYQATPWLHIPQLKDSFYLRDAQPVMITYSFSIFIQNRGYIATRVIIDGVEANQLRMISSQQMEVTNRASSSVWLGKGTHTIRVEYKTNGIINAAGYPHELFMTFLKIEYQERA